LVRGVRAREEPRDRHRGAHRARRSGWPRRGAGCDAGRARLPTPPEQPSRVARQSGARGADDHRGKQTMIGVGSDDLRIRERFDWALFIGAALVAVVGIVNLYSATSVYSGVRAEQYVNQVYWLVAGGIFAVFTASIDYRNFERLGYVIYIGGVVC